MGARYQIAPSGRIYKDGASIPLDDRAPEWRAYAAWLAEGNGPVEIEEPAEPTDPTDEIQLARAWGSAVVLAFEAAAAKDGINDDPRLALALDRYLRKVSGALLAGRLHVAYAALSELLESDPSTRPAGASDEALGAVLLALQGRLGL